MVYAVRYFGRVGFGDPEARFFSLLGHSLFDRASTVGPEVLNFLCCALPLVESILVTLRHGFDPFWVTLFSLEPVLLALRCKIFFTVLFLR